MLLFSVIFSKYVSIFGIDIDIYKSKNVRHTAPLKSHYGFGYSCYYQHAF